jgi:hypothetical protein
MRAALLTGLVQQGNALGYTLELRRLEPAPRADTPIQGYEATLVVTKGQATP